MGFRTEEKSAHYATFKQQININVSEDTKAKFAKIHQGCAVMMPPGVFAEYVLQTYTATRHGTG